MEDALDVDEVRVPALVPAHGYGQLQQQQLDRNSSRTTLCRCTPPTCTQAGFSPDEVNSIIKESLDTVLANQQYSEVKVGGLICAGLPISLCA
jgi:hypothetical protein